MKVPILDLKREYEYMKADIDAAISRCLDHQKWILGPEVGELESKIAVYLGVKHCVGVSSGTEALVLALRALARKLKNKEYFSKEDEIITTPFTFTATGDAILRSGATPVFVDIDPQTFNLDPKNIKAAISPKTVGIIPVHLYGRPCEMDEIKTIADSNRLFIVEDVAQAFGGHYKNHKLGSIGDLGCFSFFPSKNLGGFGDGGMVSTQDPELAETVRILIKHGGRDKYNVDMLGYNARLDTLQAAVVLAKFKYIDEFNAKRRAIAQEYSKLLANISGIITPQLTDGYVVHQYTIRVLNGKRDALQKYLKDNGIDTMIYYPVLLNNMKVFLNRSRTAGPLTNAENAVSEVLSLPIEPLLNHDEIDYVCKNIKI